MWTAHGKAIVSSDFFQIFIFCSSPQTKCYFLLAPICTYLKFKKIFGNAVLDSFVFIVSALGTCVDLAVTLPHMYELHTACLFTGTQSHIKTREI